MLNEFVISRIVNKKKKKNILSSKEVAEKIKVICEELKDDTTDSFASEIKNLNTKKEIKTINFEARAYVNERWSNGYMNMVSGKSILAGIFVWLKEEYKISINKFMIAREFEVNEIDNEIIYVVDKIEKREDFSTYKKNEIR